MSFAVPAEVYETTAAVAEKGAKAEEAWNEMFEAWSKAYPELRKEWDVWHSDELPVDLLKDEEYWAFDGKAATRNSSGVCVNRLAARIPNLIGGSADLAPSNKTYMKGEGDFSADNRTGRNLHFAFASTRWPASAPA